jgi:transcriptional regulator with XRE-family HTH domain
MTEAQRFDVPDELPPQRLARMIRQARKEKGWGQEELAARSEVSLPTIKRYEGAKTATPEPEQTRKLFRALGLDPRWIAVVLGYLSAEEMALPAEPPRVFTPTIEEVIRTLDDPEVPSSVKDQWLRMLQFLHAQEREAQRPPMAG